jgi:hypothetical protein
MQVRLYTQQNILETGHSLSRVIFQELEAIFDRTVLQTDVPLELTVGTRVGILVESALPNEVKPPKMFLKTARFLK